MNKFWKILAIASTAVIILAVGASLALAQEPGEIDPPIGPNFADEDGDGVCDSCGRTPGGNYGRPGGGAFGMHSGRSGWGWGMQGSSLVTVAADVLDLTVEQVVDELSEGISIAQLAANHGTEAQVIVDAFLAERESALDDAIDAGRITQEQADLMLEHMAEQIAERVDEPWTGGGYGSGMMGQGGCRGGSGNRGGVGGSMRQGGSGL